MKILFLHIFLLTGFSVSFAQGNCNIKKAYAWYNVSMPGIQMMDENGNPVRPQANITRFIYVEYSGTKIPDIKSVLYNGVSLDFSVVRIKEKSVFVGDKELNPGNTITAKKGNTFLKINLQPFEGKTMPEAACKNIIIKSKLSGKLCKFYVGREKEFASLPSY